MKRKKIYTVIAMLLLLVLYITIFCFSAEDGESSSAISTKVTKAFYTLYYALFGGGGSGTEQVVTEQTIYATEGVIRKLAHFIEYLGIGFLSYSIVLMWYAPVFRGRLLVIMQLFLSAGADELHQYFVPGRHASVKDVLLDVSGGITGMILIFAVVNIQRRITDKRKDCSVL